MRLWEKLHRVLRDLDVRIAEHGETDSPSKVAYILGLELHRLVEQLGDGASLGLIAARNGCFALAAAVAALEGRLKKQYEPDLACTLTFWGMQMGEADTVLTMWESGFLSEAVAAKLKLRAMGAHLRGRIPAWEVAARPLAQKFCADKAKVTLGQLIHRVREARTAGQIAGIPDSDEGIRAGIKRMVARGELVIPGYPAPAQTG